MSQDWRCWASFACRTNEGPQGVGGAGTEGEGGREPLGGSRRMPQARLLARWRRSSLGAGPGAGWGRGSTDVGPGLPLGDLGDLACSRWPWRDHVIEGSFEGTGLSSWLVRVPSSGRTLRLELCSAGQRRASSETSSRQWVGGAGAGVGRQAGAGLGLSRTPILTPGAFGVSQD